MAKRGKIIEPHGSFRSPVNDAQRNGQIINPPLYPQFGGSKRISQAVRGNDLKVKHGFVK